MSIDENSKVAVSRRFINQYLATSKIIEADIPYIPYLIGRARLYLEKAKAFNNGRFCRYLPLLSQLRSICREVRGEHLWK